MMCVMAIGGFLRRTASAAPSAPAETRAAARSNPSTFEFLLGLVDPSDAARARERLGIEPSEPDPSAHADIDDLRMARRLLAGEGLPLSLRSWLQEVVLTEVIYSPSGSEMQGPPLAVEGSPDPRALIEELRAAGQAPRMRPARQAARKAGASDWPLIAEADRDLPLPGYARWALSLRIGCPDELRAQFGSNQPRYAERLRRQGVFDLAGFAVSAGPARTVLATLELGTWGFPHRLEPVRSVLGEQVRVQLGGNVEAWAVFAQLLDTFAGTLSELIATTGAIAG
jgi:hypothetical protein